MKNNKMWSSLLMVPVIGIVLLYAFVLCAISKFGSVTIYNIDPKDAFESSFYYTSYYFYFSGIVVLFVLSILFLGYVVIKKRLLFSKKFSILFLALIIIYIVSMKIDVGNYLNWFFD